MTTTAYHKAVGNLPTDVEEAPAPQPDAGRLQAQQNWLTSTITKEFLAEQYEKVERLEEQARIAACNYPQTKNADTVIQLLVRSQELRNIIKSCQIK